MVSSNANTVAEYLRELEPERRAIVSSLRKLFKANLQPGFKEVMNWGMIVYEVPLAVSGPTYNKQPLVYGGIASQKQAVSLYLNSVYSSPELSKKFVSDWQATEVPLDMGKSCIRLKQLDPAVVPIIEHAISRFSVDEFVQLYKDSRTSSQRTTR